MTDPIATLIAAAKRAVCAYNSDNTYIEERTAIDALEEAIAAAEARPEPDPRGETNLREPLPGRATIAIRVGPNTMHGECAIASIGKDAAMLAGVMMRRHGEARPEPAVERDSVAAYLQAAADCRINKTTEDWQELVMMYLSNAVEALAREVRK